MKGISVQSALLHFKKRRGIEVGNIFHLDQKYSKPMGVSFFDKKGQSKSPFMGCYGLGITRLIGAIVEESHDDRGMIWPMTVSPYECHLIAINYKKEEIKKEAENMYESLRKEGIQVLFDDRNQSTGVQFKDAELIGLPIFVVLSKKTLEDSSVEIILERRKKRKDKDSNEPSSKTHKGVYQKLAPILHLKFLI